MSELLVKNKDVVVPGELLARGLDYLPTSGTYRDEENIISARLGLIEIDGRLIKLIPLSGKYLPRKGDVIIGQVIDVNINGWRLDTNSAYSAILSMKEATSEFISRGADLTRYFDVGDYMMTQIINVTSQKLVDLTMRGPGLRKLVFGRVIKVNPNKVPRIIGKSGSMVTMLKEYTGCRILVGQNGLVWIQGEPKNEFIAVDAIRKIESESHISGLTERMKIYLETETKDLPQESKQQKEEHEGQEFGHSEFGSRNFSEHREGNSSFEHRDQGFRGREGGFRRGPRRE